MGLSDFFSRIDNKRKLKKVQPLTNIVLSLADKYTAMSDEELASQTAVLKNRLAEGQSLDDILPDAFALVREVSTRVIGLRHYPVQITGGIVLHQGRIAEMQTGEGKTLVATLPAYLNALTGKGVHIVTVNDYLAKRDANWMGGIYEFLGLSVGIITHDMDHSDKQQAYLADITYATNNEIGFDYLRDNMQVNLKHCYQRGHNFAIVDEVDSILIDDAKNPLIISQPQPGLDKLAKEVDAFVRKHIKEEHYEMDEKETAISLTEEGVTLAETHFKTTDFSTLEGSKLLGKINSSLKAHYILKVDVDYIVERNEVVIIDQNTGRKMAGRRYNEGLHEAVEAKERLDIRNGSKTLATTSFQNYFRIYKKLSGMTGTALTEEDEFRGIYNLDVVPIPPNVPCQRIDELDKLFAVKEKKFQAVVEDIKRCQERGQPVLVGTASVDTSEDLSKMLSKEKIPHHILNAKNHEKEAFIIAQAGCIGAVTISTNMAGRGTDIKLGGNPDFYAAEQMRKEGFPERLIRAAEMKIPAKNDHEAKAFKRHKELLDNFSQSVKEENEKVINAGGLRIIGTERHNSRRIDNQLRGRSGRQGDIGSSCFYMAVEDDVFRKFGGEGLRDMLARLIDAQQGEITLMPLLVKQLESAQRRAEANHFAMRKFTVEYDDVINKQRQLIYSERDEILQGADVHNQIINYIGILTEKVIQENIDFSEIQDETDVDYLKINSKVLGFLMHHLPAIEEVSLAEKFIGKPLELSNHILGAQAGEDDDKEIDSPISIEEASNSLSVQEEEEDVIYQEFTDSQGRPHDINVAKLFINPKLLQKRDIQYIIDLVHNVACVQYCNGLRRYNAALYKQMSETQQSNSLDIEKRVLRGSDYEQALAESRKLLEADKSHWLTSKEIEQAVLLTVVNREWMDHIDNMDTLKRGITLRGYAQRDPLMEYRLESVTLFEEMVYRIQIETAYQLLKNNKVYSFIEEEEKRINKALKGFTFVKEDSKRVGRNAPCPCGSGRKYKNCCGGNV